MVVTVSVLFVTKVDTYVFVVAITVNFSEEKFIVNEADGVATPVLTLSRPSPCCLNLYVKVEDGTASGT